MPYIKLLSFSLWGLLIACSPPPASFDISQLHTTKTPASTSTKTADDAIKTPTAASLVTTKPASWDLTGAIAARSQAKSWTAAINWLQRQKHTYQIRLNGPLGSGAILIEKNGRQVIFRDGPRLIRSTNADALLKQQTGIRLPVSYLYYWVRGLPAPGPVTLMKKNAAGQLILLKQAGYRIEYLGYTKVNDTQLPHAIRLNGSDIFMKLVIKQWKV
ncbi:MAG: outer membrane lipoprotein LolB [Legionellaceae bacterium]|nr:outer membrane lipoprotein LolB [Legionellaceae bacterium]HAF87453.1 outer membrane lipoprotein LolB [Legionellales bacterium]|tara:strand:+ start:1111 stop:1758 length:648 start_codon:yes stop_codon:yes gene_type:complete